MDLALSEEQEMLKTSARDFLSGKLPKATVREIQASELGYSPELWRELAGLGWMGLAFPEKHGGADMSFLDLAVLIEEMGRACVPGPFLSSVVLGGLTILDVGNEEQKQEYLPKIASGEKIFTLALTESGAGYAATDVLLEAGANSGGYTLNGSKLFVPDASVADYMLVVARTGKQETPEKGITIFIADAKSPNIEITPLKTIARDNQCEVIFNQVKVPEQNILGGVNQGWAIVQKTLERAVTAKCCEMTGGMQAVFEMTVEYAKERKQFNRPIGSFQAIQHHCANMAISMDCLRLSTYQAAWMLSEGLQCRKEVAVAKSAMNEACRNMIVLAHQIHGAIGLTEDHDLPIFSKRAKGAELTYGDNYFHREIVAQEMGM